MSLLTQQTNANNDLFYFLKGNGKQLNVSSLNADFISTATLAVGGNASVQGNLGVGGDFFSDNISTNSVSTNFIYADGGTVSTLSTFEIVIDSQTLNATPTELLLNGIPLATTSNLSSLADWSLDPAISTVQMSGYDLNAAGNVSSVNVRAGNGFFTNLIAFNSLFVSTQTSTISSVFLTADTGSVSTLATNFLSSSQIQTSSIGAASGLFSTLQTSSIVCDTGLYSTLTTSILDVSGINTSSIFCTGLISTPDIEVSSINGATFGSSSITVNVIGVSSLVANSISSIGAELRTALVSTLQFNPSFSPSFSPNVNLGLGSILGNVIGWGAGVFGAAAGIVGLGTGVASLMMGRQQDFIDNSKYELINGTTQLQFSTLGSVVSSIYRVSDSVSPDQIPGSTLYISTLLPAGTVALRSVSDPLNTVSTPNSTIQAFGPWVAVPPELATSSFTELYTSSLAASSIATLDANVSSVVGLSSINGISISQYENVSSIDWAFYPAVSTINFSTGVSAVVQASPGGNIALVGTDIQLIGGHTDAKNLLLASTVSTAVIQGANDNLFGLGIQGLEIRTAPTGMVWISSPQTNIAGLTNASTVAANSFRGSLANISSATVSTLVAPFISTNFINCSTGVILTNGLSAQIVDAPRIVISGGPSTLTISTAVTAGAQGQPAGRFFFEGNDVDLGQQDLWCQQIRLGAGNPTNSQSEIVFYDANANARVLHTALLDRTIRVGSTINTTGGGYLLDTTINPPFFSTINNTSTALMAFFPSSINNTIGVSTISILPAAFQPTSAFNSTILHTNLSTTTNCIASTTITVGAPCFILAQANTTLLNSPLAPSARNSFAYLQINSDQSPSTIQTATVGGFAGQVIAYRSAVSTGTHNLRLFMYASANGSLSVNQTELWAVGSLAG